VAVSRRRNKKEVDMSVLKVIELEGTSPKSWSEAAREAVAEAAKTLRGIQEVEVVRSSATVSNQKITEYRVLVRVIFKIERT
jgi:flavin-binding protein dodecin